MSIVDPRAMLAALAAERSVSLAALSEMIGRNAAYLQQFVKRGTPRLLAERDRRLLADFFGVGEGDLGGPAARPAGFTLPRLDVAASAGPGAFVDAEITIGTGSIDPALARQLGLVQGRCGIIRVRGTSMEPGLIDGDHIVVDLRQRAPTAKSAIYVLVIDGMTMVKRVVAGPDGLVITSDNPAAPPVPSAPATVVGRVVWQMRAPV